MFQTDQPKIADYAVMSPKNMARVFDMVSLSIQQPWYNVGNMLEDVDNNGHESKYLFGAKRPGFEYVRANKQELYDVIFLKNMTIEERLLHVFKLGKVKYDTALKKAKLYTTTLENIGGCEYLWDSWCIFMADKYPKRYNNAQHVSRLHVEYLLQRIEFTL